MATTGPKGKRTNGAADGLGLHACCVLFATLFVLLHQFCWKLIVIHEADKGSPSWKLPSWTLHYSTPPGLLSSTVRKSNFPGAAGVSSCSLSVSATARLPPATESPHGP